MSHATTMTVWVLVWGSILTEVLSIVALLTGWFGDDRDLRVAGFALCGAGAVGMIAGLGVAAPLVTAMFLAGLGLGVRWTVQRARGGGKPRVLLELCGACAVGVGAGVWAATPLVTAALAVGVGLGVLVTAIVHQLQQPPTQ